MTLLRFLLLVAFLFPASLALLADVEAAPKPRCRITITNLDNVSFTGASAYDPYQTSDAVLTETFTISHRASDPCDFFVGISTGDAGSYDRQLFDAAETLSYQIHTDASYTNIVKDVPDAGASEVFSGTFGSGDETVDFTVHVVIPAEQVSPSGNYRDNLTVTLYEGTLASYSSKDTAGMRVEADIEATLAASLVASGGGFDPNSTSWLMDFGELTESEEQYVDLMVISNGGYDIELDSLNRGVLDHATEKNSEVPYSMWVDGIAIDLSGKVSIIGGTAGTPAEGDRFPITVRIGSISGTIAGEHGDQVTITVRSR